MLKLCLGFLVDTLLCVKWLARLSIFIHADILVQVSEFVVEVIYLSGGQCQPLLTNWDICVLAFKLYCNCSVRVCVCVCVHMCVYARGCVCVQINQSEII